MGGAEDVVVTFYVLNGYVVRNGQVLPLVAFHIKGEPPDHYHTVETDTQVVVLGKDYFEDRDAAIRAAMQRGNKRVVH